MTANIVLANKDSKFIIENLCQFYYYDLNTHSNLANLQYSDGQYAKIIFKQHIGMWEIAVLKDNAPAIAFWKARLPKQAKKTTHKAHPNHIYFEITVK